VAVSFTLMFIRAQMTEDYLGDKGMPQVRCPRCGSTINLENRKETDFSLILSALRSKARSFSELLRITGLPRKTLDIRLKELCVEDAIIKNKLYYFNQAHPHRYLENKLMIGHTRMFNRKAIVLLLLVCVGLPLTTRFAMAMLFQNPIAQPQPLGYYTATITVNGVSDVYGWQAGIRFDPTNLKVIDIIPGDFLIEKEKNTIISSLKETDQNENAEALFLTATSGNVLVVGQTLLAKSGPTTNSDGVLATIVFAYYKSYQAPELVFGESPQYNTMLLRMDTTEIQLSENTIAMNCPP